MKNSPKPSNIWCVGRNYREHAKELNNPIPDRPLIFLKAGSCAVPEGEITLPWWTEDIHHECELAVRINARGAPTHVGIALDLTARSIQSELKKKGEPWTLAKSFTGACPVSRMIPFQNFEAFGLLQFNLTKNGRLTQSGYARDMIFPLKTLLEHIIRHYPICEGDLVLTGTPEGVGPVKMGDVLKAEISGHLDATWSVKQDELSRETE
jgi:2-keto-4-pentenoate hydratase/2-oxohepta-3-ene-1,7-dioic acid hydratase in catechol pathway